MKLATKPGEILHEGSASPRKTHQAKDPSFNRPVPGSATAAIDPPQRTIQRSIRDDQICVLTFDRPGSSANIFDLRTLKETAGELDFVAGAEELKGLIIISAKRSIFIAGADL